MCLCYLFSAKTARQLVNRKADFLQDESTRVDSHNESNRIESNRELERCSAERADRSAPIRTPARPRMHAGQRPASLQRCRSIFTAECVAVGGAMAHGMAAAVIPRHGTIRHATTKKVKFSHTRYRALGPELIPVYRQSARR